MGRRTHYPLPPRRYGTASPDTRVTMMLVTIKSALPRDEWIAFCDAAIRNGQTVGETLRTLIQIYVEDRPSPITNNNQV
jgi:hypothetical protein